MCWLTTSVTCDDGWGLSQRIKSWSLTSLQHRLIKHARYYWLLLAEGHLNRKLFGEMLNRLAALPVPGG